MSLFDRIASLFRRRPDPGPVLPSNEGWAEFLEDLNAWRRTCGRGPLEWDPALAAAAAGNDWPGHEPGTMGGGTGQCWSPARGLAEALDGSPAVKGWKASSAHARILLSGSFVGASPCPTGCTANVR